MAQTVGYEVVVIDPRGIFLESERWSYVKRVSDFPEEYLDNAESWGSRCGGRTESQSNL